MRGGRRGSGGVVLRAAQGLCTEWAAQETSRLAARLFRGLSAGHRRDRATSTRSDHRRGVEHVEDQCDVLWWQLGWCHVAPPVFHEPHLLGGAQVHADYGQSLRATEGTPGRAKLERQPLGPRWQDALGGGSGQACAHHDVFVLQGCRFGHRRRGVGLRRLQQEPEGLDETARRQWGAGRGRPQAQREFGKRADPWRVQEVEAHAPRQEGGHQKPGCHRGGPDRQCRLAVGRHQVLAHREDRALQGQHAALGDGGTEDKLGLSGEARGALGGAPRARARDAARGPGRAQRAAQGAGRRGQRPGEADDQHEGAHEGALCQDLDRQKNFLGYQPLGGEQGDGGLQRRDDAQA
mmetsp:Transcript_78550/g.199870  ORF Transcript_78550/g.199870 Transcript_78550/m.199870 type:complete len:350 (+) Transcript_78550:238-1287(+)